MDQLIDYIRHYVIEHRDEFEEWLSHGILSTEPSKRTGLKKREKSVLGRF